MANAGNNVVINIQVVGGPATQAVNDLNTSMQALTATITAQTAALNQNNQAAGAADNNLETLGRRINLLSSSFGDQTRAMVILENRIVAIVSQLQEMEPAVALGFGALTVAIAAAGAAFAVYNERVEASKKALEAFYKVNEEAAKTDPYHPSHLKTDAETAELYARAEGADTEAGRKAAAFRVGLAGSDALFGGKVNPDSWGGAARGYAIRFMGGVRGLMGNEGGEYNQIMDRGDYKIQQQAERRVAKFEEEKAAKEEEKNAKFRAEQTATVLRLKEEEKKAMEKVVAEELAYRKKYADAQKKAAEEHERLVEQTGKRLEAATDKRDSMMERHAEAEEVEKINKQQKFKAMSIETDADALYKKMAGIAGGKGKTQEQLHDEIKAVHDKYYKMSLDKQDIIIQELTDLHMAAIMG